MKKEQLTIYCLIVLNINKESNDLINYLFEFVLTAPLILIICWPLDEEEILLKVTIFSITCKIEI